MNCPNCGAEIFNGNICPNCGTNIPVQAQFAQPTMQQGMYQQNGFSQPYPNMPQQNFGQQYQGMPQQNGFVQPNMYQQNNAVSGGTTKMLNIARFASIGCVVVFFIAMFLPFASFLGRTKTMSESDDFIIFCGLALILAILGFFKFGIAQLVFAVLNTIAVYMDYSDAKKFHIEIGANLMIITSIAIIICAVLIIVEKRKIKSLGR